MPKGERNSFSSSMRSRTLPSWSRADQREQPPLADRPASCTAGDSRRRGRGRLSRNHSSRRLKSGKRVQRARGSSVSTAKSGISPTIERTLSGDMRAVGQVQDVVEEFVLARPTVDRRRRHVVHGARRCRRSARRTWWPRLRRRGPRGPARARCASMFRQYIAIQPVPSACSMCPPVGQRLLRSKTPMLSRPRKPPWKTLRPSRVLAVHPPGEVEQQLVEDALQERAVAAGRGCLRSIL